MVWNNRWWPGVSKNAMDCGGKLKLVHLVHHVKVVHLVHKVVHLVHSLT